MIFYLVILVLLIYLVVKIRPYINPTSPAVSLAKGLPQESVSTLLSRIEWSNNIDSRLNHVSWIGFSSIITAVLLNSYLFEKPMDGNKFLYVCFLLFITSLAFNRYYEFHSKRTCTANTRLNIARLRKKLRAKKERKLQINPWSWSDNIFLYK